MKKFFKIILWIVVVLASIILIGGLFLPSKIEVSVSKEMKADKKTIFYYVNNLKVNGEWSPWEGVSEVKYSEITEGQGATMSWKDEMGGSGKQVISESKPYSLVKTELDFGEQGLAKADFTFEDLDKGTNVTWTFESDAPYPIGRWLGTLLIKPMIKESYIKGLNKLDSLTASLPKTPMVSIEQVKSSQLLSIRMNSKTENIASDMAMIFTKLASYIGKNHIVPVGPPVAIWHSWSETESEMEVGFPIAHEAKGNDEIKISETYEGKIATLMHKGAYDKSPQSWGALMTAVQKMNLEQNGSPYEVYFTSPDMEPDTSKWQTKLCVPVK
jgi:effector-binding domain-containing protein